MALPKPFSMVLLAKTALCILRSTSKSISRKGRLIGPDHRRSKATVVPARRGAGGQAAGPQLLKAADNNSPEISDAENRALVR